MYPPPTPAPINRLSAKHLSALQEDIEAFHKKRAELRRPKDATPKRDRQFVPALPMPLFVKLVNLPGKAWALYLVLWQRTKLERSKSIVLSTTLLARFGLDRDDKRRGLKALAGAGLVRVTSRGRRNPTVQVLP